MAEDQPPLRPFPQENVHETFHFVPERYEISPVDDILVLFPVLHKGDGHGSGEVFFRELPDFPWHGGGEKPCPFPLGKGVENSLEFIPKSHIEHVIPFVEDYGMNAVRSEGSPVHVVQGPSGCAHDDDRTVLERADLGGHVEASHEGGNRYVHVPRKPFRLPGGLLGKFPGGGEYEDPG